MDKVRKLIDSRCNKIIIELGKVGAKKASRDIVERNHEELKAELENHFAAEAENLKNQSDGGTIKRMLKKRMDVCIMTRAEHLEWCKKRSLEYVDLGDLAGAYASMASDLSKHRETENHPALELGMMLLMSGNLSTPDEMRKFIEGFN